MSKTKLIKITSTHDAAHINHSEFKFRLGGIEPQLHRVNSVILVGAIIPNKQFNVNSNNNVLRYDLTSAGVASLTVPIGQYSSTSLIAYIQANIAGTTWTRDTSTYLINIATGGAVTLDILTVNTDPLSTLAQVLGINTDLSIAVGSNASCEDPPDLNGTDMFLIESQALASNNMISSFPDNSPLSKNVIAVIPVDVIFNYNQVWSNVGSIESTRISYPQPRNISNIDIKITDQNHLPLNLKAPVTLIFRAYID